MTFRTAPATAEEVALLLEEFKGEFSSSDVLAVSWEALKAWCQQRHLPITLEGARTWLERDLEQDCIVSLRVQQALVDPLAEAHPSTFELAGHLEAVYIERGDLHDWTGIDEGTHDEAVARHAQTCKRCQLGAESRRIADERALALGKQPFPSLGKVLGVARGSFKTT